MSTVLQRTISVVQLQRFQVSRRFSSFCFFTMSDKPAADMVVMQVVEKVVIEVAAVISLSTLVAFFV